MTMIISNLPYLPYDLTIVQRKSLYARYPNAERKICACGCGRDFPAVPELPEREFLSIQCWEKYCTREKPKAKQVYKPRERNKKCAGDGCETMIPERSTRCGSCAAKYRAEQRGYRKPVTGAGPAPLMPSFQTSEKLTRGIINVLLNEYDKSDAARRAELRWLNIRDFDLEALHATQKAAETICEPMPL